MIKILIKNIALFLIIISCLTGCSYYNNQARQANLDIDLAKYRSTMQLPATTIASARYVVCDDSVYPCSLITPIHMATITDSDSSKPIADQSIQKVKKSNHIKRIKPTHRHLKRTSLCKN